MTDGADYVSSVIKDPLGALKLEDLVMEAMQDLMKDEIKRHIRRKLDETPGLRAEIRTAIAELLEAKVREAYAMVKLGKCGAELGIALVPEEMRKRIEKDIAGLLEKEVGRMVGEM